MEVHKLFSELASEKRLGILHALEKEPMKFTKISDKFEMTSPETSRQFSRLVEAKLVEKGENGDYCITSLGKLVLSAISDLKFISDRSDYFLNHETSPVPPHLLSRIDALSGGKIVTGLYETLNTVDKLYEGVDKYFWYISDDFPRYYLPKVEKKLDEGVEYRVIFPKNLVSTLLPTLSGKIRKGVEVRVLDEVNVLTSANDSYATLGLPGHDGKINHGAIILGFDTGFRTWCNEIFQYYWEKAAPCKI